MLALVTVDTKKVLVVDASELFSKSLKGEDKLSFTFSKNVNVEEVKKTYETDGYDALLYIPKMTIEKTESPFLYSSNSLGFSTEDKIVSSLEDEIKTRRLNSAGIDPKKLKEIEPNISLTTKELSQEGSSEKDKSTGAATAAGYVSGFLIYMFIFIYGSMVMRGVVEEKTNRIIEIIISTVKPYHLMMGKVLGISAVAVVQLFMWIVLTMAISSGASVGIALVMGTDKVENTSIASSQSQLPTGAKEEIKKNTEDSSSDILATVKKAAATINLPLIVACFLFYFIGGYLVYAGLFAAIGSAVDSETDAQQLTGPISIPLIVGFVASQIVIQNPDSVLGIVLSLFPLTSPITMMMRIPFGVPTWQLITSMVLLVATFIGTIWLSGRIFRVGILLFGKKPTWKQMIVWVFRKD
jgi:ABC-2 type transport system permease protein